MNHNLVGPQGKNLKSLQKCGGFCGNGHAKKSDFSLRFQFLGTLIAPLEVDEVLEFQGGLYDLLRSQLSLIICHFKLAPG